MMRIISGGDGHDGDSNNDIQTYVAQKTKEHHIIIKYLGSLHDQ